MRHPLGWWVEKDGQAAAEIALLLPLLLFLLLGIFAVGYWFNAQFIVTAAAREGVRQLALNGACASLKRAVLDAVRLIDSQEGNSRTTILVTPDDPPKGIGEDVTVRVIYRLPVFSNYFQAEYERINQTEQYPFGVVVGEASARMEVDVADAHIRCSRDSPEVAPG